MYELALFAGSGGGLLATQHLLGWRAVCYVERDPYCQRVLQQRIADGLLHDAPLWDDIHTFDGRPWAGCVDVVTAGFPCQPYSGAGKRLGAADERNLWPDTLRVIREVGPEWLLLENVARLLTYDYFGQILGDLAASGYDCRWDCVPAAAVGAPHIRDRVWMVGHAHRRRCPQCNASQWELRESGARSAIIPDTDGDGRRDGEIQPQRLAPCSETSDVGDDGEARLVADADGRRCAVAAHIAQGAGVVRQRADAPGSGLGESPWWKIEPPVGRVADGVADRVGQLRAIGNGQVPAVVARVWHEFVQGGI